METLDDVDDEEAFINELMALHPNDDDIVVEDLENVTETVEPQNQEVDEVQQAQEAVENVVRQRFVKAYPSIALSCRFKFPSWSLLSLSLSPH